MSYRSFTNITFSILPVSKRGGVNLDEASTVNEDFGSHMAHGDQLGPVLQPSVVLFKNLKNIGKMQKMISTFHDLVLDKLHRNFSTLC